MKKTALLLAALTLGLGGASIASAATPAAVPAPAVHAHPTKVKHAKPHKHHRSAKKSHSGAAVRHTR